MTPYVYEADHASKGSKSETQMVLKLIAQIDFQNESEADVLPFVS